MNLCRRIQPFELIAGANQAAHVGQIVKAYAQTQKQNKQEWLKTKHNA